MILSKVLEDAFPPCAPTNDWKTLRFGGFFYGEICGETVNFSLWPNEFQCYAFGKSSLISFCKDASLLLCGGYKNWISLAALAMNAPLGKVSETIHYYSKTKGRCYWILGLKNNCRICSYFLYAKMADIFSFSSCANSGSTRILPLCSSVIIFWREAISIWICGGMVK